jgi:hypothetical protein
MAIRCYFSAPSGWTKPGAKTIINLIHELKHRGGENPAGEPLLLAALKHQNKSQPNTHHEHE